MSVEGPLSEQTVRSIGLAVPPRELRMRPDRLWVAFEREHRKIGHGLQRLVSISSLPPGNCQHAAVAAQTFPGFRRAVDEIRRTFTAWASQRGADVPRRAAAPRCRLDA